ncbi:hypothetical protein SEA_YEET_208 [Mycobacterium phage Yeet]|uniref:Uncharacterized protein n=3 Tax=Omegavirus TaxID=1623292 RepID=Q853V0_BPMOM|nr:gp217 [Mycobacterium phage Omega]YP_008410363.1 hypothetical protein N860_gp202 [Mycobacterium phage Redno2]YP_009591065.1 hypothetical protein FDG54_gp203 [Mycobacterium phage Optimus]ASZ74287.1 hypothetical protein SEA_SQUINT_212 [Mycobacterium phage Squint]AWH14026.1 hypothetical protein SEA_HALLEY_218 [Mycobacterium phage Halley]AXQ52205.1 hypothetical protein SEA_EJIMIX_206 [Mycobacterium phage Ejimix]AXQ52442.1 hypothetical protein SEA_ERICMILLARD_212 [Mycobacterium phage EricMillard
MITSYERGPVKLTDDDHCGKGRRTVTVTLAHGYKPLDVQKLNRELQDYGVAVVARDYPTAVRVTYYEAKRAFENGATIVVSERGHEETLRTSESTTTHTRETTTWEELREQVNMWRGRYPNQRYYVVQDS